MKRVLLPLLMVCVLFPAALYAQSGLTNAIPAGLAMSPFNGSGTEGGNLLSGLPMLKKLKAGKLVFNPSAQVGYQHITSHMTIPVSAAPHGPNELYIGPMDVSLEDFNFWFGTLGLNIISGPLTLFGTVGGYVPGPFEMRGVIPVSDATGAAEPAVTFTGTNLNYWTAQCGVGYTIGCGASLLAGFAWSHTGAQFTDPRVGSVPLANQTLRGDVSMNIGVPFFGLQILQDGYYRGALMYSPWAASSGALSLVTTSPNMVDLRYTLNQPGTFLGVTGEYYILTKAPVSFSAWVIGTALNIRGGSTLEFTTLGPAVTRDVDITNSQYIIAGGFTLGLLF